MNSESKKPELGSAATNQDADLDRFRQAAGRHAVAMGIPPGAARHVVRPAETTVPTTSTIGPRGLYPGVAEILTSAGDDAIRDTDAESLGRKSVPEQLHAIAKLALYREFEDALREIWPGIENWLDNEQCLLGSLESIIVRDNQGHERQGQTLVPLAKARLDHIVDETSFRHSCAFVSYYVRAVWRAHITLWADGRAARGDIRQVAPHFQMAAGKEKHEEFLWSGVNTAVKMMINSVVLLHELYLERENVATIDRELWSKMLDANRGFITLFAAIGLNTFVTFDQAVGETIDPGFVAFLEREGLENWSRKSSKAQACHPFYEKRFFRLVNDQKGVPRLDLEPSQFSEELRAAFGKDIMIRRCPAMRVGVINQAYGWLSKAVFEYA
ncbi:MAG: hypothetical protein ACR2QU_06155 [Gammaproteobacteria bacterium]